MIEPNGEASGEVGAPVRPNNTQISTLPSHPLPPLHPRGSFECMAEKESKRRVLLELRPHVPARNFPVQEKVPWALLAVVVREVATNHDGSPAGVAAWLRNSAGPQMHPGSTRKIRQAGVLRAWPASQAGFRMRRVVSTVRALAVGFLVAVPA
jgi:hypothetical protein